MKRLYSLDVLRGFAALSVVVWHWQHFFALPGGGWPDAWNPASQPFFLVLKPLYDAGWCAVDLFFLISGFVFFWLYSDALAARRLAGGEFAILRFSRLYPLHLATLVLVVVLQCFFMGQTGHAFIFEFADRARFIAALFMAQQWLPPTDVQYFDGPGWSVSIEVLLYIVFFGLCRAGWMSPATARRLALAGLILMPFGSLFWVIARGLAGFFFGGLAWYACEEIKRRSNAPLIARRLGWFTAAAWAVLVLEDYTGVLRGGLGALAGLSPRLAHIYAVEARDLFLMTFVVFVGLPTIATLALQEQVLSRRYAAAAFLGDISYSVYLLHFPLQLVLALVAIHFGITSAFFMQGDVMVAFFAALIALAAASHYGFERPLQKAIRNSLRRYTMGAAADRLMLAPAKVPSPNLSLPRPPP